MERYSLLYQDPVGLNYSKTDDGVFNKTDSKMNLFHVKWWSTSMRWACTNALLYGSLLSVATLTSTNIGWFLRGTMFAKEIHHVAGGTLLILYAKDLFPRLYDQGEFDSHLTYLWFANVMGFTTCLLLFGFLNSNLLERNSEPKEGLIRPIDSIGFFVDFAFDGLLIGMTSAKVPPKCAFDKPLAITLVLAVDNVIDGLALGSGIEDSVFTYSILFFITVLVASQVGVFLRTIAWRHAVFIRVMYAFFTGLVTTAVLADALLLCKHGLTIWVGIGCLIAWTTLHIVERIDS